MISITAEPSIQASTLASPAETSQWRLKLILQGKSVERMSPSIVSYGRRIHPGDPTGPPLEPHLESFSDLRGFSVPRANPKSFFFAVLDRRFGPRKNLRVGFERGERGGNGCTWLAALLLSSVLEGVDTWPADGPQVPPGYD
ncbi:hypothetical protein KM043_016967 [Ampulex compressa]|nr:hypothetical protein KM043_016967 [Ampulex compressa]